MGLKDKSPTFASAITNLAPTIIFITPWDLEWVFKLTIDAINGWMKLHCHCIHHFLGFGVSVQTHIRHNQWFNEVISPLYLFWLGIWGECPNSHWTQWMVEWIYIVVTSNPGCKVKGINFFMFIIFSIFCLEQCSLEFMGYFKWLRLMFLKFMNYPKCWGL